MGFIAIEDASGEEVGAVWSRLPAGDSRGFAYLGDSTPELGIALMPEHRGRGVGTLLLKHYLEQARARFTAVSLSVSPNNPAMRLRRGVGPKGGRHGLHRH